MVGEELRGDGEERTAWRVDGKARVRKVSLSQPVTAADGVGGEYELCDVRGGEREPCLRVQ